jgi:hypothetical protein
MNEGKSLGQGYNRPTGCSAEKAPHATLTFYFFKMRETAAAIYRSSTNRTTQDSYSDTEPKIKSVCSGALFGSDTQKCKTSCPDQNGVHWWNFVRTVTKIPILLHNLGQFLDKLNLNRETAHPCWPGWFFRQ